MEGSRAFLVEVQTLITQSNYGVSQRVALGIDQKKLSLLIAILEKNVGINLRQKDVFLNITGGIKVVEPSLDLAIVASIISSIKEVPIKSNSVFIGEVGLSGEVRKVSQMEKRIKEATKLGYKNVFVSQKTNTDFKVIKIDKIIQMIAKMF
jgi:DNA repair protein RadA/Sms